MHRRLSIVSFAFLSSLLVLLVGAPPAFAQPGSGFTWPSVETVLADTQGSDPHDTAARQRAALLVLADMVRDSAGPERAFNLPASLRPQLQAYSGAAQVVLKKMVAELDPPEAPKGRDSPRAKWYDLSTRYKFDPAFREALIQRYLSPKAAGELRGNKAREVAQTAARVRQAQARDAAELALNRAQSERNQALRQQIMDSQSEQQSRNSTWGLVFKGLGLLVVALIAWLWLRSGKHKKAELAKRLGFTQWKAEHLAQFGATAAERAGRIQQLFAGNQGTVSYATWQDYPPIAGQAAYIGLSINRNLAAMEPRHRQMLRAVELLNNAVDGQLAWWDWARFGLIWGEGKAHIDQYNYLLPNTNVRDAHAAIDWYCGQTDAKTEAVVNHVLQAIGTPDADPRLEAAKAELRPIFFESSGSGATWLSGADLQTTGPDGRGRTIFQPRSDQVLRIGLLEDGTPLTFSGDESLISIAPPGSGKTQCNVFPNLLTWRGPAVVLDISGDLYEKTSKWRAENVGPVYKFSPLEPASSHHYNPLTFVRSEADYIWEDARLLADMMIVPSGGADQFWENEARTVLTAAIAHVCYANKPPNRPMHAVLDIMHGGRAWDEMIMGLRMAVDVRVMVQHGQSLSTMNEKTLSSVMQTARSSLGAWGGERVARVTDRSDWSPLDLRDGSNPTIYIYMRPNEVDAYLSLLRVFIGQHIRMLTGGAVPPADAKKILFMLDELPRLKNMPPIDEALNIGRKYKLQLWLFAQSLGQLEEAYKNGKGMIGSCGVRIYMNPGLQDGMAESLSEQIGYKHGALDGVRAKVVEASTLAGPDWGDYQIVLGTSSKPAKVKKAFAWQDPELASRMGSL